MSFFNSIFYFVVCFIFPAKPDFVQCTSVEVEPLIENQWICKLHFKVKEGYYIQSDQPLSEALIPTAISFDTADSFVILNKEYIMNHSQIRGEEDDGSTSLRDTFQIKILLQKKEVLDSITTLQGALNYQACSETQCFFPRTVNFQISL